MSREEPAPQMALVESPQMVSSIKLLILKKGEYTLWSMRMEQYLINTDYGLWQVIMNGDEPIQTTRDENGVETKVPLKTAQAILARQRERKAKSIMLLAIPDEYQLRFHIIKDANSLWAAIKSRFGGNVESKKMQKTVLKQQFENFYVSDTEGLDKAYDRNKEGIDELDIDDLYNNLKVFEADIKGSFRSSSNSQNVAFLFIEDTNSINEVNTANGVSTAAGHSSSGQAFSLSYTDDLMFSFFASQSNSPQLDDEDLETPRNQGNRNGDARYRNRDNNKRTSYIAQEEATKFPLMAYTLGSDTELDQTLKEKEDLKAKLEQFEISSKNLNKLINSQVSVKDKTGLGYGDQLSKSDSEVLSSVFDSHLSDGDDNPTNDKFKKGDGYHAVPPSLTENYMPPLADLSFAGLDHSVYSPTANKASASISKGEPSVIKTSSISVEMPKVDSGIGQREVRPIWNNTQRINHQNKFVPTVVITRISKETVNTVRINNVNTVGQTSVSTVEGNRVTAVKTSAGCVWRPKITDLNTVSKDSSGSWISKKGNLQQALKYKGMFDSGCSRHMTRNKALLTDYQDINEGFVAFGGSNKGGKIIATINESNLWHRRLGHVSFKTMNKLVKGNLVRGLPSKTFENDHTCVACQKGKQQKASCKAKLVSSISQPLQMLHMNLFGPTSVRSINHKTYYLVVIDDFSRPPSISFIRPFRCPVTILNTLDPLGIFVRKAEEGFLVRYSVNSKAFRVKDQTGFLILIP
nr:ribonuclease H-like domain-containing protein [Tanacetum cinerariifolium]